MNIIEIFRLIGPILVFAGVLIYVIYLFYKDKDILEERILKNMIYTSMVIKFSSDLMELKPLQIQLEAKDLQEIKKKEKN